MTAIIIVGVEGIEDIEGDDVVNGDSVFEGVDDIYKICVYKKNAKFKIFK